MPIGRNSQRGFVRHVGMTPSRADKSKTRDVLPADESNEKAIRKFVRDNLRGKGRAEGLSGNALSKFVKSHIDEEIKGLKKGTAGCGGPTSLDGCIPKRDVRFIDAD
ncbi:hypothetical protein A3I99_02545 [Candidatus Kaiserbacteria bacterium RIFCSPLOWO2_02_FULL_45_11b]|uniref:Uncharacterized protein n=1 Tax=Candidatus Kaiserbacteria bacterium RIFCSPLOWO2_12_FULL_45_26 TaxID=1798525 RepID=A0A1F6FFA2_9BACT|nr:MAG: hypothetical protein A2Z56_01735 [Candidatus Kaiserbacteria bacterium RIFCSPHIGHO2_12_45_16]OGG70266.1 MAG: hypothetical protein A2929_04290 [Candidatus Kaiserbacteria bacterium RIFCSPLOWO2_01_FULL_45_25]OGG81934.1 MAG: hypothetical protein A3I99_02545 [Candidatus Kaiserbacteria bacterium RIFCSPLOWO2_02_FULL_45_11b]OGG84530.1 MAG: hypothetical protein A3G90_00335 [Candidatus Kaiserbacteria bacterium RIFCSPLOWO2_12_FULL_45_26]